MEATHTAPLRAEHDNHINQIPVFASQRYPGLHRGGLQHAQIVRNRSRKGELLILPCALSVGYLTIKLLRKLLY